MFMGMSVSFFTLLIQTANDVVLLGHGDHDQAVKHSCLINTVDHAVAMVNHSVCHIAVA